MLKFQRLTTHTKYLVDFKYPISFICYLTIFHFLKSLCGVFLYMWSNNSSSPFAINNNYHHRHMVTFSELY